MREIRRRIDLEVEERCNHRCCHSVRNPHCRSAPRCADSRAPVTPARGTDPQPYLDRGLRPCRSLAIHAPSHRRPARHLGARRAGDEHSVRGTAQHRHHRRSPLRLLDGTAGIDLCLRHPDLRECVDGGSAGSYSETGGWASAFAVIVGCGLGVSPRPICMGSHISGAVSLPCSGKRCTGRDRYCLVGFFNPRRSGRPGSSDDLRSC